MPDEQNETVTGDDEDETTFDMELALLAMSTTNDVGGPLQEIDLTTLTATEKRMLLNYLRKRFNFAPDPHDISTQLQSTEEPQSPTANSSPE